MDQSITWYTLVGQMDQQSKGKLKSAAAREIAVKPGHSIFFFFFITFEPRAK